MTERRTAARRPLGDFVTAIFDDGAALCLGTDISESALFVRSTRGVDQALATHKGPVVVQFEIEGQRHWACGRTKRAGEGCDGDGTVIHFTYVPSRARDELKRFIHAA